MPPVTNILHQCSPTFEQDPLYRVKTLFPNTMIIQYVDVHSGFEKQLGLRVGGWKWRGMFNGTCFDKKSLSNRQACVMVRDMALGIRS